MKKKKITEDDLFQSLILGDDYKEKRELNIPYKKLIPILAAVFSVAIIILVIFNAFRIFKAKDELGTVTFEYHSSLITGEIKNLPSDLQDSVKEFVKKGTKVSISFEVMNGNGIYTDEFVIEDTIQKITQTQDRNTYFRTQKLSELQSKMAAYQNALKVRPFRVFAIGIDVTEGYADQFHFSDYLSPQDVAWLSDTTKSCELYIFSMGYNCIPGYLTWNNMKATSIMETEIQAFLASVTKSLPQTALLSQIHYIINKVGDYYQPTIVIKSDMMENTNDLSAYRKDTAYTDFTNQKTDGFLQKALSSAGVTLKPATTGDLNILLPKGSALGRDKKQQKWFKAMEAYLHRAYPNVNITMTY